MESTKQLCIKPENLVKMLGISRNTVYEVVNRADFPTVRIGRRILIPIAALERWLEEQANTKGA